MHATHRAARPPRARVVTAALAAVTTGVLLTGPGTLGQWREAAAQELGSIRAGSVSLTGGFVMELLSRQPVGSRTYASGTGCSAGSYVECRVVTDTLGSERLVPGDTLRIIRTLTLTGTGNNLAGTLEVDARGALDQSAASSALAQAATVTGTVTLPDGGVATLPGLQGAFPVDLGAATTGLGTYTVSVTVATPTADAGGGRWDERLWSQTLDLGSITASFTQVQG